MSYYWCSKYIYICHILFEKNYVLWNCHRKTLPGLVILGIQTAMPLPSTSSPTSPVTVVEWTEWTNRCDIFWAKIKHQIENETTWNNMKQHETTWNNMKQHETTWNNMKQHGTTWNNMKQHETTWNNMKQHETTWNNMKQHETTWNNHLTIGRKNDKYWRTSMIQWIYIE